jgi:hypothetical protein
VSAVVILSRDFDNVPMRVMPSRIIGFYNCTESDHRGRYLRELQQWPDDQVESVPDHIQWLFPLPEPSGFNVAVPALTRESIRDFLARPDLKENLRVEFCGPGDRLAISGQSQSSADYENPAVLDRTRTGSRSKMLAEVSRKNDRSRALSAESHTYFSRHPCAEDRS